MYYRLKAVGVILFAFLASRATAASVMGHSFFVDAFSGNDGNPGTSGASAWKSVAAVNAHKFQPGDHIYFHAGQKFAGMMEPLGSGTEQKRILVGRYEVGDLPELIGDGGRATVLLANISFWTIRDLDVSNDGSDEGKRTGVLIEATVSGEIVHGITVERLHIHNVRGQTGEDNSAKDTGGIGMLAPVLDRAARFEGITIRDCTIDHVDNIGIWLNSYPQLNPLAQAWAAARNEGIQVIGNKISDTGRNAIILRQALAPVIEGNTITHASARHHGNAIFTRSTVDAVIRGNEVSFTGTEPSGENAAFDADIDSIHTLIEYNWSHDNQGGLFSLCNNPSDDANITDGTVVRFNVSENDGIRAFGFSGKVTHTLVYNNTVFIGPGRKEAIVEARPFSKSNPHFADVSSFFNNAIIVLGDAYYDYADASHMMFDSNCVVGTAVNPVPESQTARLAPALFRRMTPSRTWRSLSAYGAVGAACGPSNHVQADTGERDVLGTRLRAASFRGAVQP